MKSNTFLNQVVAGSVAGAAGVTALNTVTYTDILVRGRGASDVPARMAEKMLGLVGVEMPGDEKTRENRLEAVGALLGIATGAGVGALFAASGAADKMNPALASALTGATAMAAADIPMALLGVSDPKTWSTPDWLSDAIPHAIYGAATTAVTRKLLS